MVAVICVLYINLSVPWKSGNVTLNCTMTLKMQIDLSFWFFGGFFVQLSLLNQSSGTEGVVL